MDVIGFIFAVTIIVLFAFVASKNLSILIKSLLRLYRDDYINDKNTNDEFQLKLVKTKSSVNILVFFQQY
jgi:hypothetical protein